MRAAADNQRALVLRPLGIQLNDVVHRQTEGRCGNIRTCRIRCAAAVRMRVPAGEVPAFSLELVCFEGQIRRSVIACRRTHAAGAFVAVVVHGEGVDIPVCGIALVANAAVRDRHGHLRRFTVAARPTCEGVAGSARVVQRDSFGFDRVAGRIRHAFCKCAAVQRITYRVGDRRPLRFERHIAPAAVRDLGHGAVLCPGAGGIGNHFPAFEGIAGPVDVCSRRKGDRRALDVEGNVVQIGAAVFIQCRGVANGSPLCGGGVFCAVGRTKGVDHAVDGAVGAVVQRPAVEVITVSARHCERCGRIVIARDRVRAGIRAVVRGDRQLAAVDRPLRDQFNVAVHAGQNGACALERILRPVAARCLHFPVPERVARLARRRKRIGAFNGIVDRCDRVAAVRVKGHGVFVRRPLRFQRRAAILADSRCGNVRGNFFVQRPAAVGSRHDPARERISVTGHGRKRHAAYHIVICRRAGIVVAVLAAAVVKGQRVLDLGVVRSQGIDCALR